MRPWVGLTAPLFALTCWIACDAAPPSHDDARATSRHGAHDAAATAARPTARFDPPEPGTYALPTILQVDDHVLTTSDGTREAMLGLAPGEAAIVSFIYLSCGEACPLATATLHELDDRIAANPRLAGRVQLVSVSFDPARDTPEALAALRTGLRPQGRWRFVTADGPEAIAPVLADYGQDAVWIPEESGHAPNRLRHVLKLFLVDAAGEVRNIYSTGFLDLRILMNDLETVLGEAA